MVAGAIFTLADFEGHSGFSGRFIGVIAWFGSLLGGSLNMALAGVLGDTKLNVLDTCAYMALPAAAFLLPIVFFISKPVLGEQRRVGAPSVTDGEIIKCMLKCSKSTIL